MKVAQDRDRLFRNYRRSKKQNPSIYQQAVAKWREFNKLIKSVKSNYVTEQLSLYKNNQVKFWQSINRLSGSTVSWVIDQVYDPDTMELCSEISVEQINNFFAEVGERVIRSLPDLAYTQNDEEADIYMKEFGLMGLTEYYDIIKEMDYSKASGVCDKNTTLLLDAMKALPNVCLDICNTSLKSGIFPMEFKLARITIIPKKAGDLQLLDNLQPISLLCIVGKLINKHVKNQIVKFFEENELFQNFQYCFRTGRSIHDAVFRLVYFLQRERNEGPI